MSTVLSAGEELCGSTVKRKTFCGQVPAELLLKTSLSTVCSRSFCFTTLERDDKNPARRGRPSLHLRVNTAPSLSMNKGMALFLGQCMSLKCTPHHPKGGREEHKHTLTSDNIHIEARGFTPRDETWLTAMWHHEQNVWSYAQPDWKLSLQSVFLSFSDS